MLNLVALHDYSNDHIINSTNWAASNPFGFTRNYITWVAGNRVAVNMTLNLCVLIIMVIMSTGYQVPELSLNFIAHDKSIY